MALSKVSVIVRTDVKKQSILVRLEAFVADTSDASAVRLQSLPAVCRFESRHLEVPEEVSLKSEILNLVSINSPNDVFSWSYQIGKDGPNCLISHLVTGKFL